VESMTGYGSAEGDSFLGSVSVEVRSVNHRFCDITIKLPRRLYPFEGRIKESIKSRFSRGRIDMTVRLDSTERNRCRVEPDMKLAQQYLQALRTLKAKLRLKGEITLDMITQAKDIIVSVEDEEDVDEHWEEIWQVVERSLDALKAMRKHEGEEMAADLRKRVQAVRGLLERIKTRAPVVHEDYRQRLDRRLQNMVEGMDLDPLRLNQEVAFFAERSDISEETVRMTSHLVQLEQMMDADEPTGRKLEFLLQEVHREANTVSSKANDETISQTVVEIKGELEKIREQIQNIE
jgi:uncharacterized protein (TIGR00255 family)